MPNPSGLAAPRVTSSPAAYPSSDRAERGTAREPRLALKVSEAVAQLERHRTALRAAIGVALLARLLLEFHLVSLLRQPANLIAAVPMIGLLLLAYLVALWFIAAHVRHHVLWFLSASTRDRLGFGMALGIGVLEVTYLVGGLAMQRPFTIDAAWPLFVVAFAHVPMLVTALHASTVFPPHDGKRPWILGFGTALLLIGLSWVAPALLELGSR